MNNINLETIGAFAQEVQAHPEQAKKNKKVVVTWSSDGPQMKAVLEYAAGKTELFADMASILGGGGRAPDPVQYCLFGTASCYAATFATIATEQGITITDLSVTAENCVNLSKTLGLAEKPIVENVMITVVIKSSATSEQLEHIKTLTNERCPGMYCLTHAIPVTVTLS